MRRLCFFIITIGVVSTIFAKGSQEAKPTPVNDTWTLCITEFDSSALPQARAVISQMVMQYLLEKTRSVDVRLWTSQEAAYYSKAAQLKNESAAAKKLSDKQAERDKLIFAGESGWRYKQNLKKVDAELETLRLNLQKAQTVPVMLTISPSVKLTDGNNNKVFPAPPETGFEYYFCTGQKADAFLAGRISEYFDRIYVEIALWSIYERRITYTDSIIFSPEDIKEGTTELADRLFDYIAGFLPAWIKIRTNPANAVIVIDDFVAGEGETEDLDFTPGTVSVTAFARDHVTFETNVELREGTMTDLAITLTPIPETEFDVMLESDQRINAEEAGSAGIQAEKAVVYDGSLYAGETPLKLNGPLNEQRTISVETAGGKVDQTVFHISSAPIVFDPSFPPPPDRTETARKKFYSAYGRFWIALPLAILGMGLNNTINSVYNATGDPKLGQQNEIIRWTSLGLNIIMGCFLAESFYRIGRYVWEAGKESSILIKQTPEIEEQPESPPAPSVEGEASGTEQDAVTPDDENETGGQTGETEET
ncbi:MAG: hypothetical protein LBC27_02900 [Spirochaetaceae bacterium]|jgi:hypothetical protein|nr:hypothetical protein [Spirochaetaceae bacterium]